MDSAHLGDLVAAYGPCPIKLLSGRMGLVPHGPDGNYVVVDFYDGTPELRLEVERVEHLSNGALVEVEPPTMEERVRSWALNGGRGDLPQPRGAVRLI